MNTRFPVLFFVLGCLARAAFAASAEGGGDLNPDPAARFGQFDNGVRYALFQNAVPQGRASLRFAVRTGSFNETETQRGLAHFLEHLAFNGSAHFPQGTLVEYFQRLGMSFGGDTNAFTSFDRTEYQLELPDAKPETVEKALALFADYGGGLLLAPEAIEKERGIILSEERTRDSVDLRTWKAENQFLLPNSILSERLPIGTIDVISHAPRSEIANYYDTWYRPENIIVVAVGDFDLTAVEIQLKNALAGLKARAPARPPTSLGRVVQPGVTVAKFHSEAGASSVNVAIESVAAYNQELDTAERRIKRLKRGLALMMLDRRFGAMAEREGAVFTSGSADVSEQFDFVRTASVRLSCTPAQWHEALGVAEKELRRALVYGFDEAELREAVAGVRNSLVQAEQTSATRPSPGIAEALVASLIDHEVFTTPADNLKLYSAALDRVTVDDCVAALRAEWDEQAGRSIFVSGNLERPGSEQEILAAYEASRATEITARPKSAELSFAYGDLPPRGEVTDRQAVTDLGVTLLTFKNGVRLNLMPTHFEAGRILVNVRFGGGLLTEPKDKPGLSRAATGIFVGGGLGRHSIEDLQRLVTGRTVDFSFAVGGDAFSLSGTTDGQNLEFEFELLRAYFIDPGFSTEALRQFQLGMEQTYAEQKHNVEARLAASVPGLLAGGDSRFCLPDKEELFARTCDEVRGWLAPQLATGPVEIALVGDFDPDAAIAIVSKTFGTLPPRTAKPNYGDERRIVMPATTLEKTFSVPTEIARSVVEVVWPATDRLEAHRTRRLNMLAVILDDRLRLKLREQMGSTYSPKASADLSDTFSGYGYFFAQAAVNPSRAREVSDAIKQVAADLAKDGVTEDELQRAKQPVLTGMRTSERQNQYWLNNILESASEQPQRLAWARDRYADTEAVSKADIDALAKQFLPAARASVFISAPAPASAR